MTCALKATWEGNFRKFNWWTCKTKSAPFNYEVWDPQRVVWEVLLHACPGLVLISLFSRPALLAAFVGRILGGIDINSDPMSMLMFHIYMFWVFFCSWIQELSRVSLQCLVTILKLRYFFMGFSRQIYYY